MKAHANIATTSAGRILTRLCKHWAHKFTVQFDEAEGEISFGDASVVRLRVVAPGLHVEIEAPTDTQLAELEPVVADHLQRMAKGETVDCAWQRGV